VDAWLAFGDEFVVGAHRLNGGGGLCNSLSLT
jgi:hypothetical protein